VQHHAERPSSGIAGLAQRRGLRVADGFLFAARGLADEWVTRGGIPPDRPLFEIMEGSTDFEVRDRPSTRRRTGLVGSPVFLWVGRLDANKDPLTVLDGFATILDELPRARLYMAYGANSPLLPRVEATIAGSEGLRRAVRLLGTVPHRDLEAVYNSADYFLLGSRHEGSGFALAEAMACGVVPIVTDIPSFRVMTARGATGALWPPGSPEGLVEAARAVVARDRAELSAAARDVFVRNLSYPAIGRRALDAYRSAMRTRVPSSRSRRSAAPAEGCPDPRGE
jgi:glycosyltransferase involved in cell wall biosynthesis